jgi:hypothetical protein
VHARPCSFSELSWYFAKASIAFQPAVEEFNVAPDFGWRSGLPLRFRPSIPTASAAEGLHGSQRASCKQMTLITSYRLLDFTAHCIIQFLRKIV